MKQVLTKDGSLTFFSEKYQEHFHSITGAKEEALRKFIEPCRLLERTTQNDKIVLLDVCFGFGYNTAAALDYLAENGFEGDIEIIGLENDENVLNQILSHNAPFQSYQTIKETIKHEGRLTKGKISLKIMIGDARETIKQIKNEHADCIFHDPFSPKKCPELWTFEFFKELHRILKKNGILTTYSCARIVRDNLVKARFSVSDGPCVGRRGPSTIAKKE